MGIKYWYVTGDVHASSLLPRLYQIRTMSDIGAIPEAIGVIILGDVGLNYYLDKRDKKLKTKVNQLGFQLYCVRGNHEARPQNIEGMKLVYDKYVQGEVYVENGYPNIKYFKDFGEYQIFRYKIAVVGGAYSVDKEYRQLMGWQWFADEQLSADEQAAAKELFENKEYDLILSHSCPYSWRPIDLFLTCIDQSKVDNGTEYFLEELKNNFKSWDRWAFGHYHDDRFVRPGAIMLYHKILTLDQIMGDFSNIIDFNQDPNY